jgi:hypothetical protein
MPRGDDMDVFILVELRVLYFCKVDPQKLYKIESALESDKWCLSI